MLASVVALHERHLGAVRTPLDRLRSASRDSPLSEDLFNRESLRCSGLSASNGKKQETDGDDGKKFFHERTPIQHEVARRLLVVKVKSVQPGRSSPQEGCGAHWLLPMGTCLSPLFLI